MLTKASFSMIDGTPFNVMDYGAVADGIVDDRSAIIAAITAANGSSLYFPPGNYRIGSTITLSGIENITLFGELFASVISVNTSFNLFAIDNTCENIEFNGLEFAGVSTTNDAKTCISTQAPKTVLQNCFIHNWTNGFTVNSEVANDCKVLNNYFKDIGVSGAPSGNGYGTYNTGLRFIVSGNTFESVGRHDVYLSGSSPQGSQYCVVANNTSTGCGVEAIGLYNIAAYDGVRYCVVANNTIYNNLGSRAIGLDVNACDNAITGNTIINPAQYGIYLEGGVPANSYPNRNTITGNVIVDAGTLHINCINGSGNIFSGNVLSSVSVVPSNQSGISVSYVGAPTTFPIGNIIGNNSYSNLSVSGSVDQDPTTGIYCGINIRAEQPDWITATDLATTVSVTKAKNIVISNSAPTTITDFTNALQGQEITLYFTNSNTTISTSNIYLAGGAPFVGSAFDTLTLIKRSTIWLEKARSVN